MDSYVSILILQALQTFYPGLPQEKLTKKERRLQYKQKKAAEEKKEPLEMIMRYGVKFIEQQRQGVTPGYYRPLANRLEFITKVLYDNSDHFRSAIEEVKYQMTDPWLKTSRKVENRRDAKIACEDMQHPEFQPETGDDVIDEMEYRFRQTDWYEEHGKTHAWFLTLEYGGEKGFANRTSHGNCQTCAAPLAVWRRCRQCAHAFFRNRGEDIYTICMECHDKRHQRDLEIINECESCWGPQEIDITFYVPPEEENL